jgi:hypothetical protein
MALDVLERANHSASAALDAVLVADDDLLGFRLPDVDEGRTNGRAGLGLAFFQTNGGVANGDVALVIVLIRQPSQFFFNVRSGKIGHVSSLRIGDTPV